jgi:hypothetical protein
MQLPTQALSKLSIPNLPAMFGAPRGGAGQLPTAAPPAGAPSADGQSEDSDSHDAKTPAKPGSPPSLGSLLGGGR